MKNDVISREAAIDAIKNNIMPTKEGFYEPSDVFCELTQLPSAQPEKRTKERTETHACDCISRQAAVDALWKALYGYEDKTEKQFIESDELDVADWIGHRIFVQNMNDIDRQTILELPSAQPERKTGRWIPQDHNHTHGNISTCIYFSPVCSECGHTGDFDMNFCPNCGCRMMEVEHDSDKATT